MLFPPAPAASIYQWELGFVSLSLVRVTAAAVPVCNYPAVFVVSPHLDVASSTSFFLFLSCWNVSLVSKHLDLHSIRNTQPPPLHDMKALSSIFRQLGHDLPFWKVFSRIMKSSAESQSALGQEELQ